MRRALVVVLVASWFACAREEAAVSRHAGTPPPVQAASVLGVAPVQPARAAIDPETLFQRSVPTSQGFRDVSPDDLARARGSVTVVDVRQPGEFTGELGHVPGATLVPLDTLAEAARDWDRDAPIVLVCRSGRRSSTGAAELVAAGFKQVMNLSGGMTAWGAQGLPVER